MLEGHSATPGSGSHTNATTAAAAAVSQIKSSLMTSAQHAGTALVFCVPIIYELIHLSSLKKELSQVYLVFYGACLLWEDESGTMAARRIIC